MPLAPLEVSTKISTKEDNQVAALFLRMQLPAWSVATMQLQWVNDEHEIFKKQI